MLEPDLEHIPLACESFQIHGSQCNLHVVIGREWFVEIHGSQCNLHVAIGREWFVEIFCLVC